jgi:hypothetical protein
MLRKFLVAVILATFGFAGALLTIGPVGATVVSPGAGAGLALGVTPSAETPTYIRRGSGGYRGGYRGGHRGYVYRRHGYRGYGYRGGYRGYGYRGYGYRGYGYRGYGYGGYGYGCRWVSRRVWTAYGYRWVRRRVCY